MIKIKIVIDAFGGDYAPTNVIKSAIEIKKELPNLEIIFAGNEKMLRNAASNLKLNISDFEILNAKDHISPEQSPREILKEKSESSMAIGLKALNDEKIDAFITAGSTGALAVGASFFNSKIKGVKRAALCPTIPSINGKFLLIDAGANLQCREDILFQFAVMGNVYAKKIFEIEQPKIGLANVGIEPEKGLSQHKEAYKLLSNCKTLNFIGNVEARYAPLGICDVVVSDGLCGNMILKTMEGTAKFLMKSFKEAYSLNFKTKLAAAILRKQHNQLKKRLDYKNYGGAILLGINKPLIKAHGNSTYKTLKKTIKQAVNCVEQNIVNEISCNIN